MRVCEERIPVRDGGWLAATLYLPDESSGPQPCLVEALPYRKDDLTSSYTETYVRLRDEFGFAVCRVDVRGTGSSGGALTLRPAQGELAQGDFERGCRRFQVGLFE